MDFANTELWVALWQIVVVDVLLSGDNAVVIALACRNLPPAHRNRAIVAGTAGAVGARLLFCFTMETLLQIPALKLVGGVLLLWIGIKLMLPEDEGATEIKSASGLWSAIRTIVIADLVMSLDNVIGIVAAAKGHLGLIAFGLCLSIPLIVFGSRMVMTILQRFPVLIVAGAGLLGWLAGEIMTHDPILENIVTVDATMVRIASIVGLVIVVAIGLPLKRRADAANVVVRASRAPSAPVEE